VTAPIEARLTARIDHQPAMTATEAYRDAACRVRDVAAMDMYRDGLHVVALDRVDRLAEGLDQLADSGGRVRCIALPTTDRCALCGATGLTGPEHFEPTEVERLRAEVSRLHVEAGRLPSGEGCAYARRYGMEDWHEHDHGMCQDAELDAGDEVSR
jgi:hypothetical protein